MTPQRHISALSAPAHLTLVHDDDLAPLLAAAKASVLDLGLRRTTLAEIARRAGVSRMTVYRQYGDRDALVAALLTAELVGALERITADVASLPTARERLVSAAVRLVRETAQNEVYRRILDLDPELLLPLIVDRFGSTQRAAIATIAEQVKQGRQDGSVRTGPSAQALAEHLLAALQSFVFSARVLEAHNSPAVTGREIRALVDGYLRP
jgi:AcrR family transcriptional regulator